MTNGYGGIRPFDPGGQQKKMSPKTPFNTFGRFNDRFISSNNGKNFLFFSTLPTQILLSGKNFRSISIFKRNSIGVQFQSMPNDVKYDK